MEYSPEYIGEISRTYGEISVYYKLVEEGIEPWDNAEKCLVAISNYKRLVPREVRQVLGINLNSLEERCKREIPNLVAKN